MGNESSKSHSSMTAKKLSFSLKSGPSSSTVQRHLETAQKTRVLQLKNCSMKNLPEQIQELTISRQFKLREILRNLDVSNNRIRSLPTFIGIFENLRQLHLSNNEIAQLPDEIGLLKRLELLDVSNNHLVHLPDSFAGLRALRTLNLSQNKFTVFPISVCHLASLENLDISSNMVENLPNEVKYLAVSEMNLNQNRLNSLNQNLVNCEKLRTLRVEENCLGIKEFSRELLTKSNISLISFIGNLFQEKHFQDLPGYDEYQTRYTATKRKM